MATYRHVVAATCPDGNAEVGSCRIEVDNVGPRALDDGRDHQEGGQFTEHDHREEDDRPPAPDDGEEHGAGDDAHDKDVLCRPEVADDQAQVVQRRRTARGEPGQLRGRRADRGQSRLRRAAGQPHPVGVRLRARVGVPAADGHIPVGRHPGPVNLPQPAVGGRRLRPDGARLPGRAATGTAGLHRLRRDHAVAAAVHVRAALWPEHGLPRVHPEPDPRAAAPPPAGRHRGDRRHQPQRRRGDQRRGDHGGGVLDLRHVVHLRVQGVRHRDVGGGADRRHDRARRAAAGRPRPARRPPWWLPRWLGGSRPAMTTPRHAADYARL